jgi:hypothetical protein
MIVLMGLIYIVRQWRTLQILGLLFFYQYIAPPSAGCPPLGGQNIGNKHYRIWFKVRLRRTKQIFPGQK